MRELVCVSKLRFQKESNPGGFKVNLAKFVCPSNSSWIIELAKGKPSVEVSSGEELVKALTAIKTAVEAGELDSQIEQASDALKSKFTK